MNGVEQVEEAWAENQIGGVRERSQNHRVDTDLLGLGTRACIHSVAMKIEVTVFFCDA